MQVTEKGSSSVKKHDNNCNNIYCWGGRAVDEGEKEPFIGKVAKCLICGLQGEIEPSDQIWADCDDWDGWYYAQCLNCGHTSITAEEP